MRLLLVLCCGLALWGCGSSPRERWIDDLRSPDVDTRRAAVRALGAAKEASIYAVPALRGAVRDDADRDVRPLACTALGDIGSDPSGSVPVLQAALEDAEISVRLAAAFALLKLEPTNRAALPVLQQLMRSGEGGVIVAVGKMGPAAEWSVPTLTDLLRDRRPGVRRLAAEALGRIGSGARTAIPSLEQAQRDPDDRVREAAAGALQAIAASTTMTQ